MGILAIQCARVRGARIALIDNQHYRLDFAQSKLGGLELNNFYEKKVVPTLKELFPETNGPDVAIEAVGFHYTKSIKDKVMMTLGLETDPSTIFNELIMGVKKRGRIGVVSTWASAISAVIIMINDYTFQHMC